MSNSEILSKGEEYYNKMELAYKVAIDMPKDEGIQYFRQKEKENHDLKYNNLPVWLITSLESQNFHNEQIILNPRRKAKDMDKVVEAVKPYVKGD